MRKMILISQTELSAGMDFIEAGLSEFEIGKKQKLKTMLVAEESLQKLIMHAESVEEKICIALNKKMGSAYLSMSLRGQTFELIQGDTVEDVLHLEQDDQQTSHEKEEEMIRDILLRANKDQLRYKNKKGTNIVEITVRKNPHAMVMRTMFALAAAIVIGLAMKAVVPDTISEIVNDTFLTSISTMFLNALKMVVGPVVFFSIVSCISQFGDLKEVGRIGGKIMGFYMLTTVLAIIVATAVFYLLQPGNPELASKLAADASTVVSSDVSISIKDTIVGIVPSNFVKPFLESNMMQLIFMAVLIGIAVGKIGEYSQLLKDIFEACNSLFLKITVILVQFIPIATFCSILSVILKTGPDVLLSMLAMLGTFAVGILAMMCVYCLLMIVIGRLNPVPFLKNTARLCCRYLVWPPAMRRLSSIWTLVNTSWAFQRKFILCPFLWEQLLIWMVPVCTSSSLVWRWQEFLEWKSAAAHCCLCLFPYLCFLWAHLECRVPDLCVCRYY